MKDLGLFDQFRKVIAGSRTEEYLQRCEPFEQQNKKFLSIGKAYADAFHMLYETVAADAYRSEYANGGLTIHRGFYSPSALDMVVGGVDRGCLYKRKPRKNPYDYEYVFNAHGDMICCNQFGHEPCDRQRVLSTELFIYEKDSVLSLTYEAVSGHRLSFITECQYNNGKTVSYESALWNSYENTCVELDAEWFAYSEGSLKSVSWSRYMPSAKLLTQNVFTFFENENGVISTYCVQNLDKPAVEPVCYKVKGKPRSC